MGNRAQAIPDAELREMEVLAVDLARLAGTEITSALGSALAVRYKPGEDPLSLRDPVSEVDTRVEDLIRTRVAEAFPGHEVLGEEVDDARAYGAGFIWAIDPIDGTTNFINGFPLFAGSIGILHGGRPVVGAVWTSTSHALRPGVYHAREGGPLMFDTDTIRPVPNAAVRRRLVGSPGLGNREDIPADPRRTGSAAVECAFVAAGLLQAAWFATPNVWDIAAGLVLVRAAGGEVRHRGVEGWGTFTAFHPPANAGGAPDLRAWRGSVAIGEAGLVASICDGADMT